MVGSVDGQQAGDLFGAGGVVQHEQDRPALAGQPGESVVVGGGLFTGGRRDLLGHRAQRPQQRGEDLPGRDRSGRVVAAQVGETAPPGNQPRPTGPAAAWRASTVLPTPARPATAVTTGVTGPLRVGSSRSSSVAVSTCRPTNTRRDGRSGRHHRHHDRRGPGVRLVNDLGALADLVHPGVPGGVGLHLDLSTGRELRAGSAHRSVMPRGTRLVPQQPPVILQERPALDQLLRTPQSGATC